MMTPEQIRLYQNPILSSLLLGTAQGKNVGARLFPQLPSNLSGLVLPKLGDANRRRYGLRRAPGSSTKRVNLKFESKAYVIDACSVDIPVARELIREFSKATMKLDVPKSLEVTRIAMETADSILALDYELECAELATDPNNFAPGHVMALSGLNKWSSPTSLALSQINDAADMIRRKTGVRPNCLTLSGDAFSALSNNAEIAAWLPASHGGPAKIENLKVILDLEKIEVGDSIWVDEQNETHDVWNNVAILSYTPEIDPEKKGEDVLVQPAFGLTAVQEGHPFAEEPYYEASSKSWVFGATFERRPYISTPTAGFLFLEPV